MVCFLIFYIYFCNFLFVKIVFHLFFQKLCKAKNELNIFNLFLVKRFKRNKKNVTPELQNPTARQNSR